MRGIKYNFLLAQKQQFTYKYTCLSIF